MSPSMSQRSILPIPDQPAPGLITYDAKDPDTSFPPIETLVPPAGAPNVLVVLLDDIGFGASSAFGGPVDTPVAQRLAAGGLRYNRFHTTALCAPTRAALLSGRNHHSVGMGSITETATSAPGNSGVRPNTKAPLAMTLKLNGYSTAQLGKCHEVPPWQSSPMGPFDAWPAGGGGFEYFYGFIGGETNQYYPSLYEGLTPVEPPEDAGGGLPPHRGPRRSCDRLDPDTTRSHAGEAVLHVLRAGRDARPPPRSEGVGRQVPGEFAHGWDRQRELTFERQKELGVIPADAQLTPRHAEIPAWDDMPEELKPVLEREMEVYAGFLEHTDHHVGRLIDTLEHLGILEDTLVYYIIGDNGASAEGTLNGAFNEMANFNGEAALETPEFMASVMDKLGTPEAYNHYAVGWAWAMDTPYQWTKQVASHWGGTRNGMIVHWPSRIEERGGIRSQFTHCIDLAPTILEAAGLPEPTMVNGVLQSPMEGVSMLYSFNEAEAAERHDLQYFEMFGNRGIYHKGWSAVTKHRTPWQMASAVVPAFDDDVWELYDGSTDWSQAQTSQARCPTSSTSSSGCGSSRPCVRRPADRRSHGGAAERRHRRPPPADQGHVPAAVPRHAAAVREQRHQHQEQVLLGDRAGRGAQAPLEGVIIAQGGTFGGWAFYAKEGKSKFAYNVLGLREFVTEADEVVPQGEHQLRVEFAYDGGGLGKGGGVTLFLDGDPSALGASRSRSPSSSPPTRRPISGRTPACP